MKLDFVTYVRLFVGPDDAAKLAKLQEMKAFAEEELLTPMPPVTPNDVKAIQRYLEEELDRYPNARQHLGL